MKKIKLRISIYLSFLILILGFLFFLTGCWSFLGIFKKTHLNSILEKESPITNNISDAVTESSFLDDYNPLYQKSMLLLSRSNEGGFIIKRPGAYSYRAESYCLHAGAYAPENVRGGNGYLYASLKGPQSHIFRNILQRSTEHPEIRQFQIQGLIWAILSRTKITKLSPLYYPAAIALLTPKEMLEVSGGAIGLIPDRVIDNIFSKLPPFSRKIYEAEARLRRIFTSGQATFEEIERIAVLTGDPPNLDGDRRVPSGRWSYHPNGFWIRYYPSGYSSTQIKVTVPLAYEIERDNLGRIIRLSNERADTLEFSYDDKISITKIENDINIKGYAYQSVKYTKHEFMTPEAIIKKSHAWANQGYTLVGIPSGNGIATIINDRYLDIQDAYNQSILYKNELEILSQQISLDNVFGDLMDIIHLSISLEKLFKSSEDENVIRLTTNMRQFLKEGWQHIFNNYNGQYDNRDERTYDPAESIAQPGKQGRQRLAQSGRSKDKEEEHPKVSIRGVGPLLLYRTFDVYSSPTLTLEGVGEPPGGIYTWSVITGAEKIQLHGDVNHHSLQIEPLVPSDPPGGDVVLQLTYTTSDGTETAQVSLTVHTPSSAVQIATNPTTFNGPVRYGYDFTVRYRILDQFGEPFPVGELFIEEDLVVLTNTYNTTFIEKKTFSDSNAEYDDHYELVLYQPVPNEYLARVRQVVRANGVEILDHILVWKSTHVEFE